MIARFARRGLLAVFCVLGAVHAALADTPYPSHPIRLVVPYTPGGNTDVLARLIAQRISPALGQEVIVDNRPGANTLIGTQMVARAPADGYTILFTTLTFTVAPALYEKRPYDPVRDFSPISLVVTLPNVLVVNPAVPATTLREFIVYAKANPGKLNYASTGSGTSPHLSMELLKSMAGIDATVVQYKGGNPALTDLIGNQVQAQFIGLPVALPLIASGKLRALGLTSKARSSIAPTIPTIGETLPGYEMDPWFGMMGPANLPKAITDRIQQEVSRVLGAADMKERLVGLGAEAVGGKPEEFAAHLRSETARYEKIVKENGIKPE